MENKSEKTKSGTLPKYSGEGITIWENTTKNGDPYLTVQLFGKSGIRVNCWLIKTKQQLQLNQELIGRE